MKDGERTIGVPEGKELVDPERWVLLRGNEERRRETVASIIYLILQSD
jgi:hypothetical protein